MLKTKTPRHAVAFLLVPCASVKPVSVARPLEAFRDNNDLLSEPAAQLAASDFPSNAPAQLAT
jgi:hypothetical protein